MAPRHHDPETLLAEDGFLRRLAHSLVHDAGHADDLVQQAWLGMLGRRAAPARLHAWLAAAVRNLADKLRRSEERRGRRELQAARPEAIASPAEILEREAARRAVVEALLELDAPSRDALILRYFDDLPPRLVAQRLGVPVETARTRIKRALERLRVRLDQAHGGERAGWGLVLLPCVQGPGALATWMGVLDMSRRTVVAGGVLLSVLVGGAGWAWWPRTASPGDESGSAPIAAIAATRLAATPVSEASSASQRVAVETAAQARTGSVRVRVVWGEDHTPAEGIKVQLVQWRDPKIGFDKTTQTVVSAADGTAVFAELAPWTTCVYELRGGGSAQVMIRLGEQVDARLEIRPGILLRGTVVAPDDTPVAGAVVRYSDGGALLEPVATTAADGSFVARSMSAQYIGARAEGYAPSLRHNVIGSPGQTIQLRHVLAPACELNGQVLGPMGEPVPNATVQVGMEARSPVRLENGEQGVTVPARMLTTDGEGRFHAAVQAGDMELAATAPGYAPCYDGVVVEVGRGNQKTIRLDRGITVRGRVTDGTGAPVPTAWVGVSRQNHEFGAVRARVAADGSFELPHASRDRLYSACAWVPGGPSVRRTLSDVTGDELRWDPVLAAAPQIRGQVVDERGAALSGWNVSAQGEAEGSRFLQGGATTGADGRFVIQALRDAAGPLAVHEPGAASGLTAVVIPDVRPGKDEVRIQVPDARRATARITGRVSDSRGAGIHGALAIVWGRDGSGATRKTAPGTGSFSVGPVRPGTYQILIQHPEWPELLTEEHDLEPGATWDLGHLTLLDPGTLLVTLPAAELAKFHNRSLHLVGLASQLSADLGIQGNRARSRPLAPGNYRLQVQAAPGAAWKTVPFTIRSGVETRLDLALEPGVHQFVRLIPPPAASPATRWQLAVHAQSGELAFADGPLQLPDAVSLCLVPGPYRVLLTGDDGGHCEAALEVPTTPAVGEVAIQLR